MKSETNVNINFLKRATVKLMSTTGIAAMACTFMLAAAAQVTLYGQGVSNDKPRMFATAQAAGDAFIAAMENFDEAALRDILGPDSYDIIHTGEPAVDRELAAEFTAQARIKKNIAVDSRNRNRAYLEIGDGGWPLAVPIVKQGGKWAFDVKAGRQEVLFRRIGRNELTAIEICRGFVEAQREYALEKRDGARVNQYAQRLISSPGKQDGLAWQNADGTWGGTVGERAARAIEQSYTGRSSPFHGYLFKVLKGQGPSAPSGEMDFMVKGAMIGGFALLAYPAQYQVTGVKTFMVSHDGIVYEKDLGIDTLRLAAAIDRYDPDKTWLRVLDE